MNKISKSGLFLLLTAMSLATIFFVIVNKNRPIADDYNYLSIEFAKEPIAAVSAFHYIGSGRYAQGFDQAIFAFLFSGDAVIFYPVFLFALTIIALTLIIRAILILRRKYNRDLFFRIVSASFLISTLFFCAIPHIIDSVLWFSSATVHLAGVVYAILSASFVLDWFVYCKKGQRALYKDVLYVLAFLYGAFHFTHSEAVNVLIVVYVIMCLIVVLFKDIRQGAISFKKTIQDRRIQSLVILGLMAGIPLIVMYFSPAVRQRSSLGMGATSFYELVVNGLKWNLIGIKRTVFSRVNILSSAVAAIGMHLMFCDVFLTLNKKRALRYVLMIGVGGFFAGLSVALLDVFAVNGINYRMILIPMFNYFIITTIVFLIILNVWKGGQINKAQVEYYSSCVCRSTTHFITAWSPKDRCGCVYESAIV